MKIRTLIACIVALLTIAPAGAQAPEKDIVVVDFFLRNRVVPAPYVEMLRAQIIGAFAARGRQSVVDAQTSRTLATSLSGTGITDPATAATDLNAFLQQRAQEALAEGARYLVTGAIVDYKFEHAVIPSNTKGKAPVQGFKSSFRVVVSALDLRLGKRIDDQLYELTATAPIADQADQMALARINSSLDFYILNRFKIETTILELCPADRKGRIKELYIHSGHLSGVTNGDLFLVYAEVPIGGVMTRQKIGKIRVNDAQDGAVSKCKISDGAEQIASAFLDHSTMICISDGKALFY